MTKALTFFATMALLCTASAAFAKMTPEYCDTLLAAKISNDMKRDYAQALEAWTKRTDLKPDEIVNAEFIRGFGMQRQPVILIRTGKRMFILDRFNHQIQIHPKTEETVRASYTLVGESSLSPNFAGQRYEFLIGDQVLYIDFYKERKDHLKVQTITTKANPYSQR